MEKTFFHGVVAVACDPYAGAKRYGRTRLKGLRGTDG